MNCPVCASHPELVEEMIEPMLTARRCPDCGGEWIRAADYWRWRAEHGAAAAPTEEGEETPGTVEVHDAPGMKVCPDCRHFMATYRVGHGVPFRIDHCRNCDGVWLDRDEWAALRARGLNDDLHLIFFDDWQRDVRDEERRALAEAQFERQVGAENLARIREVKAWLDANPHRSELYAYLQYDRR
ncbi:MAG TPA: zf-TFIIB domain-containing protein [Longimicrobiaceae bacterium]|jgi:Zn-finger nucleic acid-binding protein|nr:zf-TFIIB domain-containing protein [Longimicrobiaceae bacterium]